MSGTTNIVLVHGAWADGSSWSKIIPTLQDKGFNVTSAQLSLNSIEEDTAIARRLVSAQQGPTLLVGHSYGGIIISAAGNDAPQVKGLVYIAGWGNDQGESIASLAQQGPAPAGAASVRPDAAGEYLWIDTATFASAFAADVDPLDARIMAVVQRPLGIKAYTDPAGPPAWRHLPSWYLVSANDQMIPPAAEEFFAKRMGATTRTVPASHASLVSRPREVVELIAEAAAATRQKAATA